MGEKRYGPTLGAGTVVIEKEGSKSISPSALGGTCFIGSLEKGKIGELISADTESMFAKKCGGYVDYSSVPDAVKGFGIESGGAGELFLIRVTDGTEITSEITLKNRRTPRADVVKIVAKSPGAWAGKYLFKYGSVTGSTDLHETTLDTGWTTLEEEQLVGGTLELFDVTTKTYLITGFDGATGEISVGDDQTMLTDAGTPTGDVEFVVTLANGEKYLGVKVGVNQISPLSKWTLDIIENGIRVYGWDNLSSDPDDDEYFVSKINDDGSNYWITVSDLWTGSIDGTIMPADYHGISSTLTATTLGVDIFQTTVASVTSANGTIVATSAADVIKDTITLTCSAVATVFAVASSKFGTLADLTVAVVYVAVNKYSIGITITQGSTVWATGDTITIEVNPLMINELEGGYVVPNYKHVTSAAGAPLETFIIDSNTANTVTVSAGYDMTVGAVRAAGDEFLLVWPSQMVGGHDGVAGILPQDYLDKMGVSCVLNSIAESNKGLIKISVPGINTTSVQKAGVALAKRLNYQFRYEIPHTIVEENAAITYVNDTLGRSEFAVVAFPSYGYITNPTGPGMKLIPLTGDIQGKEAAYARNNDGYHKAATDIAATLSRVLELPTEPVILNEEKLNPVGIQIIKKKNGNYIIWGDRTLSLSGEIYWKHKRELLSYYEHVLQENFDWIIFSINDETTEGAAKIALRSFFREEYRKRAIRGNTLEEAAIIKIDSEINTAADRAAGNMYAEISLRLADVVERFIMTVSQQGIYETTG